MTNTNCQRCDVKLQTNPKPQSNAKMLKHSNQAKGLCVNCAVHDWLRNTYPVNLILAGSGPNSLRFEHIQRQFTDIMRSRNADATPDEIDWEAIITNWDLPFPHKLKPSAANPVSQAELDREPAERIKREARLKEGLKPTKC